MPLLDLKITIESGFPGSRAVASSFIQRMADLTHAYWSNLASQRLKTTQADYIQGIQRPKVTSNEAVITLVGWLPFHLETGLQAFDQKPGLLSHRTNGRFVVPFEHQASGTAGIRAKPLPSDIYATLFAQGRINRAEVGQRGIRSKLNDLVGPGKALGSYTWQTSPYAGLTKTKKGSGSIVSFRTVSANSAPGSWVHPGLTALNLRRDVAKFLAEQAPKVFKAALASNIRPVR